MSPTVQLPKERVALLAPSDIETYLLGHGWEAAASGSTAQVGMFFHGTDRQVTVLVPRDRGLRDYALRVGEVLHTLAIQERRPIWEVMETLLARRITPTPNGPAIREPGTAHGAQPPRARNEAS